MELNFLEYGSEFMMLQNRIAGLIGLDCMPGPSSYLMARSRIAIFHTFFSFQWYNIRNNKLYFEFL
jgi:hypothetical protein